MADETEKSVLSGKKRFIILIIGVFLAGWFTKAVFSPDHNHSPVEQAVEKQATIWTCSMHPQIRQPKPGKCPICFMDLIPVNLEHTDSAERQISFSPQAVKLMEVQTTPVERKFVSSQIKLIGKLDYDQTRIKSITAWTGGRIDRLFVDYTGMPVRKGDHMVELYSPELISAQSELLESLKSSKTVGQSSSDIIRRSVEGTLKASREKLRLLGVSEEQIKQIESTGKVLDHLTIPAPIGGVVIDKMTTEGMYVQTGMAIYTIADLSRLWVIMDAYESDLAWIRFGQKVEFTVDAAAGKTFTATVSFISPVLDEMTRTVKVRAVVDNPDGVLKPGMFVRGLIHAQLTRESKVMDASLAGKYICPMHGEIIKDAAGMCDICGMALVKAEDLGYQTAGQPTEAPLVIPATAPLITGKKAVVYVQLPDANEPTFEGREIVLGPRAGDYYIVEEGLAQGEIVVTNGNFKIDASLQIQAKPSMMSPEEKMNNVMPAGHHH